MMISDHGDPLEPLGSTEAGGQNVYVYELSRALGRRGWLVDVFTRFDSKTKDQIVNFGKNTRVIRIKAGPLKFVEKNDLFNLLPEFLANLILFIKKERNDYSLIHSHYYFSGWLGVELKRIYHIPLVETFHSLGFIKKQYYRTKDPSPDNRLEIEKMTMRTCDKIISTSDSEKKQMIRHYGASAKKIQVIPAGVNLQRFKPVDKNYSLRKIGYSTKDKIILFVGRIEKRKGIDTLIKAIPKTIKGLLSCGEGKNLKLIIVGGNPLKRKMIEEEIKEFERLKTIVKKLSLRNIVKFVGGQPQDKLKYFYSAADIVSIPSYYEPFGMVTIEAMACGTPVIGSRVGGIQTTIKNGKNGYLVPAKNPEALADKLIKVLADEKLQKQLGQTAIDIINHRYTWKVIARDVSDLYKKIIKDGPNGE